MLQNRGGGGGGGGGSVLGEVEEGKLGGCRTGGG